MPKKTQRIHRREGVIWDVTIIKPKKTAKPAVQSENQPILLHVKPTCRCGCGRKVISLKHRKPKKFFNNNCRVRFMRQRKRSAGISVHSAWTKPLKRGGVIK